MPITRYFGMAPETDYNEAWDTPTMKYLDIAEANITGEQNPESVPSMTYPGPTRVILGDYNLAGPINTVADTDLLGHLLKAAFGNHSLVQESPHDVWQHIFNSISPRGGVAKLPYYKIALGEDVLQERRLSGCYVPSLELSFTMGEALKIVANVISAQETKASFSAPEIADHPADSDYIFHMNRLRGFVGESTNQIELGVSGEGNALEALSLTLNNNPTDDWRKSGSRFIHDFFVQEQEITGSMTLSFENMTELYRYFEGSQIPSAVTPADRIIPFPLIFPCDLAVLIDTSNGSTMTYRLVLYMPSAYYTSYSKPQTVRDRATIDIGFKALIPRTAPDLDAITYNSDKVAEVEDTEFTDAIETNRINSALYAVLVNAVSSYTIA